MIGRISSRMTLGAEGWIGRLVGRGGHLERVSKSVKVCGSARTNELSGLVW